jgi:uncharacterized protein YbjT (DUF2867 family)
MRIAVAGATGYIGSNVARACLESGFEVRVLTRDAKRIPADLAGHVEPFVAEVTRPATLKGFCRSADVFFSSVGMYIINKLPSLWDVDYHGNMALLEEAQRAGVGTIAFVSVLRAPEMARMSAVAEARELVVQAIQKSGIPYLIYRPTGFFNDMSYFIRSIRERGMVFLPGDPNVRINPLDGRDFGDEVARVLTSDAPRNTIRPVGGPEILTRRQIAELAFAALGREPRIHGAPIELLQVGATVVRPFHSNFHAFLKFLEFSFTTPEMLGEPLGYRRLYDFLVARVERESGATRAAAVGGHR